MKSLFAVIFILGLINNSIGGELIFSGVYQGKNLYVQNPYNPGTKEFCTNDVFVNEIKVLSQIKNSAYTIHLSHLESGAAVTIKITHKEDCTPKIVNPFVLQPTGQTYTFSPLKIENNTLSWSLKQEVIAGRFIVEKYTENYWKPISSNPVIIDQKEYSFNVQDYISEGTNKYRVKYLAPDELVFISSNIIHESKGESVTLSLTSSNKILLSKESPYEIIDEEGNKVTDGKGNEIAISNLNPGTYYINYGNKSEKFLKK